MPTAPSIELYTVGKGRVEIRVAGSQDWRDIGNCPQFAFTPELEKLEHFSSRSGVRTRDLSIVIEKKGTLAITMDEWDRDNLALAVLGTIETDTLGEFIDIFSENAIQAEVRFTSTNEVGPKYQWYFPRVDFIPESAIELISDEFAEFQVSGDVQRGDTGFGTIRAIEDTTEEPAP